MTTLDSFSAAGLARLANVAGAVLTGGASQRMGRDKAHVEFHGEPLSVRTARLVAELCEDVVLVGGDPPADAPGRRVPDPGGVDAPRCALRGIVGALEATEADRILLVATDMPLLNEPFLASLVAWPEASVVVPRSGGRANPLCAVYRREEVLPVARERLAAGADHWKLTGLLDAVGAEYLDDDVLAEIDPSGVAGRSLENANTAEELERIVSLVE